MTAAGIPFAKMETSRSGSGKTALTRAVATSVKSGLFASTISPCSRNVRLTAPSMGESTSLLRSQSRASSRPAAALSMRERAAAWSAAAASTAAAAACTDPSAVARSASAAVSAVSKLSR